MKSCFRRTTSSRTRYDRMRSSHARDSMSGTLRIGPPPDGAAPRLRAPAVLAVARQGESRQVRRTTPEIALGSFRVPTGVRARTENRLVWVVLFRELVVARVTPVVLGTRPRATATTAPEVRVDLLVIVDDLTGTDVLRSEFASGSPSLVDPPR